MVEMLGVLAIIGVLTVGGIAGFQKAINRYKLDKIEEKFRPIFGALFEYKEEFRREPKGSLVPFLEALGAIDTSAVVENMYFHDIFNNKYSIYNGHAETQIDISLKKHKLDQEICQVHYKIAKKLHNKIINIEIYDSDDGKYYFIYWGDKYCSANKKCLKDLSIVDIAKACKTCDSDRNKGCGLHYILYELKK